MMKNILMIGLVTLAAQELTAQSKTDTVIVELTRSSRVIFTLSDTADLPLLRQYDFQALFRHILNKVEGVTPGPVSADSAEAEHYDEVTWEEDEKADREWREKDWEKVTTGRAVRLILILE